VTRKVWSELARISLESGRGTVFGDSKRMVEACFDQPREWQKGLDELAGCVWVDPEVGATA
jgi:hypothetical protein